jgi:hypothetical protein
VKLIERLMDMWAPGTIDNRTERRGGYEWGVIW